MIMTMDVRVWVGCLAHYNNGALIGEWVDATEAAEWECPESDPTDIYVTCEETWIFDHEIPGVTGEMSPMTAVEWGQVFAGVGDHEQKALAAFLSVAEISDPADFDAETFRDRYRGQWDSLEAFAEDELAQLHPGFETPWGFRLTVCLPDWESEYDYRDGHVFSQQ